MGEPVIHILVVDDDPARGRILGGALADAGYEVLGIHSSAEDLVTLVCAREPDIILIDVESPARDTIEQIACITRDRPRAIALFSPDGDPEKIRAAIAAGVSAYTASGLPPDKVRAAIETARAQFQRFQKLQSELDEARQSIADRKFIERAKGFIISQRGCGEPEAFQLLQKMAMDRRKKLAEVARDIVSMADILGKKE